jgi:very-short-patch-repair endonuclease
MQAEVLLWSQLRWDTHGFRFRRQHPIGPYIADFACVPARLVIEVDGGTHCTDAERRHDALREAFLRSQRWHVLRVWNGDVYDALDCVVELVCQTARMRIC